MTAKRRRSRVSFLAVFLALVLIAVTVALGYRGWSVYLMSAEQRVEHPDFRTLRATGMLGNGYGWVAALLVIMNLSYLVRRRFGGFGSMPSLILAPGSCGEPDCSSAATAAGATHPPSLVTFPPEMTQQYSASLTVLLMQLS